MPLSGDPRHFSMSLYQCESLEKRPIPINSFHFSLFTELREKYTGRDVLIPTIVPEHLIVSVYSL